LQVQTAIINPHNEEVQKGLNPRHPDDAFFPAASDIINRTPKALLLIAGMLCGMQIVGIALIQKPPFNQPDASPLAQRLIGGDPQDTSRRQPCSLTAREASKRNKTKQTDPHQDILVDVWDDVLQQPNVHLHQHAVQGLWPGQRLVR